MVASHPSPSDFVADKADLMSAGTWVTLTVWLVDPAYQTLEMFAPDGAPYRLLATHAGDDSVNAPPFDAQSLDLAPLWRR